MSFSLKYVNCGLLATILIFLSFIAYAIHMHSNFVQAFNMTTVPIKKLHTLPNITAPSILSLKKQNHGLCVATRVQNSADMFSQWIEYHLIIGVHKFFIINDCSSDNGSLSYLGRLYEKLGFVAFFDPSDTSVIPRCVEDRIPDESSAIDFLVKNAAKECDWIAVIDLDEYITPIGSEKVAGTSLITEDLYSLNSMEYPVFRLQWMFMSSHNLIQKPPGLMIENYIDGVMNLHIKSIAYSKSVQEWRSPHCPTSLTANYTTNVSICNLAKSPFIDQSTEVHSVYIKEANALCEIPKNGWFLRHYFLRSWEEYSTARAKRKRHAGGGLNGYINNMTYWKQSSSFSSECSPIGSNFTKAMALLVRKNMFQTAMTIHEQIHNNRSYLKPRNIFNMLLTGNLSLLH